MNILREKRKRKEKKIKNIKFKPKRIVLVALLLMMTTLAWFTYTKILNVDVGIHINSWDIKFYNGDEEVNNDVSINLLDVYPGMEENVTYITIVNNGETNAEISYTLSDSISILGQEYKLVKDASLADGEPYILLEESTVEDKISTTKLIDQNQVYNNGLSTFPFGITIEYTTEIESKSKINASFENTAIEGTEDESGTENPEEIGRNNIGYIKITTSWEEKGEDNIDTKWGYDVAEFIESVQNGDITENLNPISFNLRINAVLPRDN